MFPGQPEPEPFVTVRQEVADARKGERLPIDGREIPAPVLLMAAAAILRLVRRQSAVEAGVRGQLRLDVGMTGRTRGGLFRLAAFAMAAPAAVRSLQDRIPGMNRRQLARRHAEVRQGQEDGEPLDEFSAVH